MINTILEYKLAPEKVRKAKRMDTRALERVEHYMSLFSAHPFAGTNVGAVLDDATSTRGKMLRPRLLLAAGAFGPDFELAQDRLCKLAAMVELTHLASLIHDDIVDDAPYRRGVPSIQGKYGKDAAVYAGDFIMSRISFYIAQEDMNQAGAVLARTVEEMCAGEIGQALARYREDVSLCDYMRNIHGKTAALFMAACRIGAMESGCDPDRVCAVERLGECLGLMFQLRDDVLDFTADTGTIGKTVHKDFQEGIYTMPVLCALEQPGGRDALLPLMRANAASALTAEQVQEMVQTVIALGGVEKTCEEICRRRRYAEDLLESSLPHNDAADLMRTVIRKVGTI